MSASVNGEAKAEKASDGKNNEASQQKPIAKGNRIEALDSEAKHWNDMLQAADRYSALSTKLGGHQAVSAFLGSSMVPTKPAADPDAQKTNPYADAEAAKELLKEHKLDNTLKDRSKEELGLPDRPAGYGAKYLTEEWKIPKPNSIDNPVLIDAVAWKTIVEANRIFHGFFIRESGTLTRARFPAFELRSGDSVSGSNAVNYIPHFEVFDESSISIKETETELERSMAQNSFSSVAVAASLSGGAFGVSAAASFGYNRDTASKNNKGDFANRKEYTATYNFPRARVFVDEYNLKLTKACTAELLDLRAAMQKVDENVKKNQAPDTDDAVENALAIRDKFFSKFGHIFATNFQLGGQLFATRSASSNSQVTESEERDAMKMSAALSFSSPYVSGSASASRETSDALRTKTSGINNVSALSWSARGGNTLLCANPPEWANSLGSSKLWRVIEREEVYSLPDIIAKIITNTGVTECADLPRLFNVLEKRKYDIIPAVPKGNWTGRIRLEPLDGRKLASNLGFVESFSRNHSAPELIFTVFDADISRREPQPELKELYADHPIFLIPNKDPSRQSADEGGQFGGLSVTSRCWLALKGATGLDSDVCRWSLRPSKSMIDYSSKWQSGSSIIRDGDEVTLYCHSTGPGPFRKPSDSPYWAPTVYQTKGIRTETDSYGYCIPRLNPGVLCKPTKMPDSTPEELKSRGYNYRFWRALFDKSNASVKTLLKDPSYLAKTIYDYDRNKESNEQSADIEVLRKILGLKDTANQDAFLKTLVSQGIGQVYVDQGTLAQMNLAPELTDVRAVDQANSMVSSLLKSEEIAEGAPGSLGLGGYKQAFLDGDSLDYAFHRAVGRWEAELEAWKAATRSDDVTVCDQQVTFRVRYV